MAVSANLEWKLEEAFVTVFGENTDLAGIRIVRARDTSAISGDRYPCIAVGCTGASDTDWSSRQDYEQAYMECSAITYARTDTDAASVNELLGAMRDSVYASTFITRLTGAVTGLTVYGAVIDEPALIDDDSRRRVRSLTVKVYASAQDI